MVRSPSALAFAAAAAAVAGCSNRAHRTPAAEAPADAAIDAVLVPIASDQGYDFRRVRYYPDEIGQVRPCDVSSPLEPSGPRILHCSTGHGGSRIALSWDRPIHIEVGDQLAIRIDGVVDRSSDADVRGHLIGLRARHRRVPDPHAACECGPEHPTPQERETIRLARGFDFTRVRDEPRLIGTRQLCLVDDWHAPLVPVAQGKAGRWQTKVSCRHQGGLGSVIMSFATADIGLMLERDAIVEVRIADRWAIEGVPVDAPSWKESPIHVPPWER